MLLSSEECELAEVRLPRGVVAAPLVSVATVGFWKPSLLTEAFCSDSSLEKHQSDLIADLLLAILSFDAAFGGSDWAR